MVIIYSTFCYHYKPPGLVRLLPHMAPYGIYSEFRFGLNPPVGAETESH